MSTATLYRWWDTTEAIMLDAAMEHVRPALTYKGKGSPLERLRQQAVRGIKFLRSEDGKVMARLNADDRIRSTPTGAAASPASAIQAFAGSPQGHEVSKEGYKKTQRKLEIRIQKTGRPEPIVVELVPSQSG